MTNAQHDSQGVAAVEGLRAMVHPQILRHGSLTMDEIGLVGRYSQGLSGVLG
jgi:hypothetical protein